MARSSSQIRIISGKCGGRLIDTPKTNATHPMGERERSAIFNRLRDEVPGRRILDAFAGSGAIGIEALSLGASHADFMEKHPKAIRTIQKNLANLQLADRSTLVRIPDGDYGIILADPPYDHFEPELIDHLITFLKPNGILALSHPGEAPGFDGLTLLKSRNYAGAAISIYQK